MNKFKEVPEEEQQPAEKKSRTKKSNKIARSALNIFSGNFLSKDYVIAQLPFILFLTLIGLGYIANGYYAEKSVREISHINTELKELKSEYIISKSELMFMSNQSEVAHAVAPFGLKESTVPPKKIVVKVNGNTQPENKN
ncbi:MAG: FtsL-like putative cell division protein [Bacteroidia bacterium]